MAVLAATQVFTGTEMLADASIHVEGGRIVDVRPGVSPGATRLDGLLAPGLIDVQVNGGGGAMFNDAPTAETLRTIAKAHTALGVTGLMATLVSDERAKISAAIDAVEVGLREGIPGLLGLHLEGPWLSGPRRGVHPQRFLRPLDSSDASLLARKRPFPMLITVAPEQVSPEIVRALVDAGVTVSIGHTEAVHEQVEALLDSGATGFTHLFNAMPPMEGRRPGPVGVALARRDMWAGLILDGIHVNPISARAAFAAKSASKLMLVSDAMATVGSSTSTMTLFGEKIEVSGGALRTRTGVLAGAHLSLSGAVRNAVAMLGASVEQALQMASLAPAAFLRQDTIRGRIAAGARADMVLFGPDLDVRNVWIAGTRMH
jgi:N-acetylglucosamine-6-phosphate deacetylase